MLGQGIPRAGFEVYSMDGEKIGQLTSGTFSPLLRIGVGMGYVEPSQSLKDTLVNVNIRGKMSKARVSAFPLYDPEKYGYKRKVASA
jgi:aminomethyltransferase